MNTRDIDTALRDDLIKGFVRVVLDRIDMDRSCPGHPVMPEHGAAETLEAAATFMIMMLVGYLKDPRREIYNAFQTRLWDAIMCAERDHEWDRTGSSRH